MGFRIGFGADEWERQVKHAIQGPAAEAFDRLEAQLQSALDNVERTHAGKDLAEVKTALRRRFPSTEFNLDDDHITAYAGAIAAGQHVQVEVDKSELDKLD